MNFQFSIQLNSIQFDFGKPVESACRLCGWLLEGMRNLFSRLPNRFVLIRPVISSSRLQDNLIYILPKTTLSSEWQWPSCPHFQGNCNFRFDLSFVLAILALPWVQEPQSLNEMKTGKRKILLQKIYYFILALVPKVC